MNSQSPSALRLHGSIITDGTIIDDGVILVSGGKIDYAGQRTSFNTRSHPDLEEVERPAGTLLLPGMVDVHCHGAAGGDFPGDYHLSAHSAVKFLHASGTTTLLASLVTAPRKDLLNAAESLRVLLNKD